MGIIYQQKFGAAMGSPVSPLLASLFIEWLEKHAIAKVPAERKPFWDRYELTKKGQVRNLTDHMNTTDPTVNIKFSNKEEDKQPILRHSSSPTGRWISETSSIRSWVRIKRWTVWTINYLSSERYTREMLQWWRRRRRIERRLTRCQSAQHLPGPSTRLNRTSRRKHRRTNQRKERIYEVNTKVWLSCHNVKGLSEVSARILKSHGIATANRPHRTLQNFVVHQGWKEDRIDLSCSLQKLLQLLCWRDKQEVRSEDQGTQERSGLFHSWYTDPEPPGQGRAV